MNTRAAAAAVLVQVVTEGTFLNLALESALPKIPKPEDRAFVQALCYGVLRWYWRLDRILAALTRKPIKDMDIRMLALIGLYQLRYTRVKPHAAVSETVAAAQVKIWAKPLLNGILRSYQREQERLEAEADAGDVGRYAHPAWLVQALRKDWPEAWRELLVQNNEAPPLALRLNRQKSERSVYLERLQAAGIGVQTMEDCPSALVLEVPMPVEKIPGFAEGVVSVQDAAAQFAAPLLEVQAGQRVLDLCAAPGGKTVHLLESCPELRELVAVDIAAERIARVRENLERSGLSATLVCADAAAADTWWDGRPFERILVDAPCSATGVIRRHPDIKVLRQPGDLAELVRTQRRILAAAWRTLVPAGRLLYATCSVLRRENEENIAAFLAGQEDAREVPIEADWGVALRHGRQILTGRQGMDGFYYALLEKVGG